MNGPAQPRFRDPALVDFGTLAGDASGRRLEAIGGVLVDRPLPHDRLPPRRLPATWKGAVAFFERGGPAGGGDGWRFGAPLPQPWQAVIPLDPQRQEPTIALEVRPAPSGQIGIFLEQVPQWQWLFRVTPRGSRVLSLFGHSGAATLALAAAGADVVHVDASKPATALARRNAAASALAAAPIRWICDDARAFVAREVRRGAAYDGVVLDPPSWGHGTKGQAFSIDRDLGPLLADVATLLETSRAQARSGPILLTCHSPGWHQGRLCDTLTATFGLPACDAGPLACTDASGRQLILGDYARHAPHGIIL
jgi:23S rRNA (cytosine1962-C5)-methyltransferase